jgi:hypothetical protein
MVLRFGAIGLTLRHAAEIGAFDAACPARRPWLFRGAAAG